MKSRGMKGVTKTMKKEKLEPHRSSRRGAANNELDFGTTEHALKNEFKDVVSHKKVYSKDVVSHRKGYLRIHNLLYNAGDYIFQVDIFRVDKDMDDETNTTNKVEVKPYTHKVGTKSNAKKFMEKLVTGKELEKMIAKNDPDFFKVYKSDLKTFLAA